MVIETFSKDEVDALAKALLSYLSHYNQGQKVRGARGEQGGAVFQEGEVPLVWRLSPTHRHFMQPVQLWASSFLSSTAHLHMLNPHYYHTPLFPCRFWRSTRPTPPPGPGPAPLVPPPSWPASPPSWMPAGTPPAAARPCSAAPAWQPRSMWTPRRWRVGSGGRRHFFVLAAVLA